MIPITPIKDINGFRIYKRKFTPGEVGIRYAIYAGLFWVHDSYTLREARLWSKSHTPPKEL
jgi:hypothetical protein